jgi:hypothetical protein
MTYRGILNRGWFSRPKAEPIPPKPTSRPVPPPAEAFAYHPDDSEPLPVGKSAERELWRELGYDE